VAGSDFGPGALSFEDFAVDQNYLSELGTLEESSALVRAQGRAETLETRVATLEQSFASRLRTRLTGRRS
jgi:hypothetical protein